VVLQESDYVSWNHPTQNQMENESADSCSLSKPNIRYAKVKIHVIINTNEIIVICE
jgi:hypothetical protein